MVRKLRLKAHPTDEGKFPPAEKPKSVDEQELAVEGSSAGGNQANKSDEFGVYRASELNVTDSTEKKPFTYMARNSAIGVAIALLLVWLLWPAGEEAPAPAKPSAQAQTGKAAPKAAAGEKLTVMLFVGNVRSKPSAKADILFQLEKGAVVTKLDSKWGWHQIRLDDGRTGWAYQSLFVEPEIAPTETAAKGEPDAQVEPDAPAETAAPEAEPEAASQESVVDSESISQPEERDAAQ